MNILWWLKPFITPIRMYDVGGEGGLGTGGMGPGGGSMGTGMGGTGEGYGWGGGLGIGGDLGIGTGTGAAGQANTSGTISPETMDRYRTLARQMVAYKGISYASALAGIVGAAVMANPALAALGLSGSKASKQQIESLSAELDALNKANPQLQSMMESQLRSDNQLEQGWGNQNGFTPSGDFGGGGGATADAANKLDGTLGGASPTEGDKSDVRQQILDTINDTELPDVPEYQINPDVQAAIDELQNTSSQIKQVYDLTSLTGELSGREKELLQQIIENRVQSYSEEVNRYKDDAYSMMKATMTAKGLLSDSHMRDLTANSTIVSNAIVQLEKGYADRMTTGIRDIETAGLESEVGLMENKATRALNAWGLATDATTKAGSLASGEAAKGQQWEQWRTELPLNWNKFKTGALTDVYQLDEGIAGSEANRALQWNIAQSQKDASENASMWNAFGNVAGWYLMS